MKLLFGKNQKRYQAEQSELERLRQEHIELAKKAVEIENRPVVITPGPSSVKDEPLNTIAILQESLRVISPEYDFEVVPIIRKLVKINATMSQAFTDIISLSNTGHKILFDPSVGPSQIDEMREFIIESSKNWHVGAAGINGVVNKMFRQLYVSGAIACEWVPNLDLDNLEEVRFLYPERMRAIIEKNTKGYQWYQQVKNINIFSNPAQTFKLRKLNKEQFRYFALNGDTDLPYGVPPYLAALDAVVTQRQMKDNIKFITQILGVLGYLDASIEKPDQIPGESVEVYKARLTQFLTDFKKRVMLGMRDGVNVGFKDEHVYEFKETARTAQGVGELYQQNEQEVASGLNFDIAFMGRGGSSETMITILFTKMISQLSNVQDIVRENLEYGYKLALTLGGFKFKNIKVQFNRSTITDDLKYQQAEEIKIRNVTVKYQYGLISQEQMADELGYIKPDQSKPRIDINNTDPQGGAVKKQKREAGKNKSDRKVRDKNKPQGTTRKGGNKKGINGSYAYE